MSATASTSSVQENNNVISPGEYVLKKLFSEFVLASQQKLDFIFQQTLVGNGTDIIYPDEYIISMSILPSLSCVLGVLID